MFAFENPDFVIEDFDLLVDVLMNVFCLLGVIESSLVIALLDLFNNFGLILLKHVLNFNVDFLLALC